MLLIFVRITMKHSLMMKESEILLMSYHQINRYLLKERTHQYWTLEVLEGKETERLLLDTAPLVICEAC